MYLRVWCSRCGDYYEIYGRDDIESRKARTCPHCQEGVSAEAWAKVIKAAEAVDKAGAAVYMDRPSKTRFTVDYIDDSIFKNCRTSPLYGDLL